jgi:RNA polymerase sigma-70 factor, ECF subfamily
MKTAALHALPAPERSLPQKLAGAALHPAFTQIFSDYFEYACRSLQRFGVGEADLEDIAQELFMVLARALPDADLDAPLKPWILSFVVRHAANYRRLARHRGQELTDAPVSTRVLEQLDAKRTVLRALDAIDDDKREALVLHDLEGLSAREIAALLSIPENTVYSRVRLAREGFRRAIDTQRKECT